MSEIGKKASRYPQSLEQPLDLLIYTTHWRFLPNQTVLRFLAYNLKNINSSYPFAHVWHFAILSEEEGRIDAIYPSEHLLDGFNYSSVR
jgi:hypothetical protein